MPIFAWNVPLLSCFSHVRLCDPRDGSHQAPPSLGFSRQEYWSGYRRIFFSNAWNWKVKVKSLSRVRLLATPWTAAHQAPLSMGFTRQGYWSGVPLPSLKCSLGISNFLEEIFSFSHYIVFLYFFCTVHLGKLSNFSLLFFEILPSDEYIRFSFAVHFSSFSAICKTSSDSHLPFCIYFSWGWFWSPPPVQCHKPPSIFFSILSIRSNQIESICYFHCIIIRDCSCCFYQEN